MKLTLGKKLLLGFGTILVLMTLSSVLSYRESAEIKEIALCGMTTLRCAKETSARFAALMLGESAASDHSSSGDALGELCNMVAGNFKSKISTLANHCMLSVPTVITGADYSMETSEPTEVVLVPLLFEGQPVWVSLVIHT